jgi:hypothetical protein
VNAAPRSLFVVGFDSGLKLADRYATAFEARGWRAQIVAPTTETPHQLSASQVEAATKHSVEFLPWREIVNLAEESSAVVPIFDGSRIERFITEVHLQCERSGHPLPVFGTAYVGMVLYNNLVGYLFRSLGDVVAVNTASDLDEFARAAHGIGLPADNLLLVGLSLLPAKPAPPRTGQIRRVLFADQPTVPFHAAERAYLYSRLADYARVHPEREVVIRPRHQRGEATFHTMEYSPEDFVAAVDVPQNLLIDHAPIADQLSHTDVVLSVSSTAILEAIAAGCRVAFVSDFLGETMLNHRFVSSGLLRTLEEVTHDDIGTPHPDWLADVFPGADAAAPADRFAERMIAAVEVTPRPHSVMWDHPYHVNRRRVKTGVISVATEMQLAIPDDAFDSFAQRLARKLLAPLPRPLRRRLVRVARALLRRV